VGLHGFDDTVNAERPDKIPALDSRRPDRFVGEGLASPSPPGDYRPAAQQQDNRSERSDCAQ